MPRSRKAILDYRVVRGDRVVALTEDSQVITLDTFSGLELVSYSIADMQHKNIFTFMGDQVNIETHAFVLEDGQDGRLWLSNMKNSKEKVSRKSHIRFLTDF
jgi:hypothetical protein